MRSIYIKSKKKLIIFPLGLLVIGLFAFSPFLIGMVGMGITEFFTGKTLNEGNSIWGVLPWLTFYTFPIGFVIAIGFSLLSIYDIIAFIFNRNK